ncbi:DNA polymerase III subunit gamma/tau [Candidatus Woesebacteria bacterium]|nr:DNA polymerase III subunit gamma/tau [Candidatus Woesebacteria bacterium]
MTTLYLKYRPQTLDDLDQEDIRESLKKIVSTGEIPHAFLFAGPKGIGKTSAARIIAKALNCENPDKNGQPCGKCEQCESISKGTNLDVIEMDAASNRGIDDVRVLREGLKLAPIRAKKKVYIIDEAHMLTTEASNALLKTLEEPPDHVVFILATTNPEKLIETIRSRTTVFTFKRATDEEIIQRLEKVADGEKVKIASLSLKVIAKASGGSFRDSIKIFEQMTKELNSFEAREVEEYLFKTKAFNVNEFLDLLIARDTRKLLEEVERVRNEGVSMVNLSAAVLGRLRLGLLFKVGIGEADIKELSLEDIVYLIELFENAHGDLKETLIEQLPVELAVIKWCGSGLKIQSSKPKATPGKPEIRVGDIESKIKTAVTDRNNSVDDQPGAFKQVKEIGEEVWKQILTKVRPINASVEALLRAARPIEFDGKNLVLGVYYKFHKERLEEVVHRKILEDIIAQIIGCPIRLTCELTEPPIRQIREEVKKEETVLTEGTDRDIMKVAEDIFNN